MNTGITTRHCELSESLKQRTEERLHKLQRYFDRILDARVVVSLEKNRYTAEATLTANGTPLTSHVVADSDRAALEQVMDKLEVQIRKHKDRLTRRRRSQKEDLAGPAPGDEEGEESRIMAFDDEDLGSVVRPDPGDFSVNMPLAEAIAQLRVSRREVLGFTNRETRQPCVVFKHRDGSFVVVDVTTD